MKLLALLCLIPTLALGQGQLTPAPANSRNAFVSGPHSTFGDSLANGDAGVVGSEWIGQALTIGSNRNTPALLIPTGTLNMYNTSPGINFFNTAASNPGNPTNAGYNLYVNTSWLWEFNYIQPDGTGVQTLCQMDFFTAGAPSFSCVNGINAGGFTSVGGAGFTFNNSTASLNNKIWQWQPRSSTTTSLMLVDDAQGSSNPAFTVTRSGTTAVSFGVLGSLIIGASGTPITASFGGTTAGTAAPATNTCTTVNATCTGAVAGNPVVCSPASTPNGATGTVSWGAYTATDTCTVQICCNAAAGCTATPSVVYKCRELNQ